MERPGIREYIPYTPKSKKGSIGFKRIFHSNTVSFFQFPSETDCESEIEKYHRVALEFLLNIETVHASNMKEHSTNQDPDQGTRVPSKQKISYKRCLSSQWEAEQYLTLNDYPPYLRDSPIKDSMNAEFRENFPYLDPKLTLSQLLNLREELIQIVCRKCEVKACTLAIAFAYFEYLLNCSLVTKGNRKLYAAVCVLLAYKFEEETHLVASQSQMKVLVKGLHGVDKQDMLGQKSLFLAEFEVYVYLNFKLQLEYEQFEAHYQHILSRLSISH